MFTRTSIGTTAAVLAAVTAAGPAGAASEPRVRIASVSTTGAAADGYTYDDAISADGGYVAFTSMAANLVPGDTNGARDLFVRDLKRGLTRRADVDTAGEQSTGTTVSQPGLSKDGHWLVFTSDATNLVPGDTNGSIDVFVRDLRYGITTRASLSSTGGQLAAGALDAGISGDGRYVVFASSAAAVPGDTNGTVDVFVRDLKLGTTRIASVATGGGQAGSASMGSVISGDGRYVAFYSYAGNLVPGDTNSTTDVFRHDLKTGETIRVSVGPGGAQTSGGQRPDLGSLSPAISADGNRVPFGSYAGGLTAGPHAISDVYVRDVKAGTTTKASPGIGGAVADGSVATAHISPDGRYVGYGSAASNLVPGDTNGLSDGFVHDLKNGTTRRVTVGLTGQQGDDRSSDPALDDDADHAAFTSQATNLVPGDTNGEQDAFVTNL